MKLHVLIKEETVTDKRNGILKANQGIHRYNLEFIVKIWRVIGRMFHEYFLASDMEGNSSLTFCCDFLCNIT